MVGVMVTKFRLGPITTLLLPTLISRGKIIKEIYNKLTECLEIYMIRYIV